MAMVKITTESFSETVLEADKPVLLDFYGTWCGTCRIIAPVLEQIAEEREDIIVGKIDVEEEPYLANRFAVSSLPLLVMMHRGEVVSKLLGARSKSQILAMIP